MATKDPKDLKPGKGKVPSTSTPPDGHPPTRPTPPPPEPAPDISKTISQAKETDTAMPVNVAKSSTPKASARKKSPRPNKNVTGAGSAQASNATAEGVGVVKGKATFDASSSKIKQKSGKAKISPNLTASESAGKQDTPTFTEPSDAHIGEQASGFEKSDADVVPSAHRATHHSLNDRPSTIDSIGFEPYATALAKLLLHKETVPPLVIGVYGRWGNGKTTFLSSTLSDSTVA